LSVDVKKGVFVCNTSTGNQSVTGVGFQPKAIILWGVKLTSNNTFESGDNAFWFGAATSATERWCMSGAEDDAVATSNTGRRLSTNRVITIHASGTPTTDAIADLVSFDADGFTINWSDAPSAAWQCHYMALGGDSITNAKAGTAATTPTPSTSITGVGFTPGIVIMAGVNTAKDTDLNTKSLMIGAASAVSSQAVVAMRSRDAVTTTDNISYQDSNFCFAFLAAGSNSFSWRGSLASFDANGFTINWQTYGGTATDFCYLALKGGQYAVLTDTQRTSTTGTKSTTNVGYKPRGALFASWGRTASNSIDNTQARLTVSASDGNDQGGFWWQSADNVTTTDLDQKSFTDKALLLATQPSTTDAEADLASFDADGFTLNWTTVADSTARQFIAVLFGHSPITPATQDDTSVAFQRLKTRVVSPVADAQTTLTLGSIHQRAVTTATGTDTARIIKVEAKIVTRAFDHPAPVASSFDARTPD
jgi:hypothetical protein